MPDRQHKIWCFFDLDGTLINKDSYLPFLFEWKFNNPKRILPLFALPAKCLHYLAKGRDRSYLKEAFLTAFMKRAKRSDVELFIGHFWSRFLKKHQNEAIVNHLKWHSENGHAVHIVTGSFDFYADYLKEIWPVQSIIATRAEWIGNKLSGKIIGKNCKGKEKVFRIEKELGINLKNVEYYAYTDSYSDIPLLRYAAFPVIVNSKKSRAFKNPANIKLLV